MQNLGLDILDWITIERLLSGLYFTLEVAFISIIITLFLGTIFGILRTSDRLLIRVPFRLYLEVVRVLPTLVLLYLLYYILPKIVDIDINGRIVGIFAFSFWGVAEMSDIVRSSILSLPKHQRESGQAIGLNPFQLFRYLLLPQALKIAIAPALNLSARIIMTTSLLVLIGVQDVIKVGKEIIEYAAMTNNPMAPFWIYGLILLIFFLICYPLSKLASKLYKNHS
ncbi:MAG TPA: ABC transporter permease subunit [Candidatus Ignatzschineria merdigallinarum]|uniref:ABC transporter permease subunit n=1 Tax=Candidatus Ignatzschineria merdigallinarum TaxID=2838621 RepID=A0A9D1Q603_9GAMM|nr:ABC transporter permease subunit [Candidatus Ignatzschineria merdigallinarum]